MAKHSASLDLEAGSDGQHDTTSLPAPESPASRHFNQWLDRALPLLQQQLATFGFANITSRQDKPKH